MSIPRRELQAKIHPASSGGVARAAAVLSFDLAAYCGLFAAVLAVESNWAKAPLAVAAGLAIARLFLIGHDACHGVFFPSRRANALVGRLVFLPSLTPYSTWELGHNTLHHGFTNLRGKDYVYTPFSKAEFGCLPTWRQRLERVYRHPLGPGLHYAIEVWWKRLWFPLRQEGGLENRDVYYYDSALTLAFLAVQIIVTVLATRANSQHPVGALVWAVVVPFVVWNALMGFVTYQQHTHPDVRWYAQRSEWDPVAAQVHGTAHILFPAPVGFLLGNIMDHTAHHLDVGIPMFDLPEAQRRVESEFPGEVTIVRWSPGFYLRCCRQCKLYDYTQKRWTGFDD